MKKNLIQFLFGESQVDDEIASLVEDIADMDTEGATTIKVDKAPLSKVISDLGIEGGTLEADPRGLSMSFDDGDLFRAAHALLNEPDSMHKLASAGWVYSLQGDIAQTQEPADFRIRFLEIDEIEPENLKVDPDSGIDARNKRVAAIMKAGREFATTEPGHDGEMNPVEFDDKTSDDRGKGVGKEKDGAKPEGKPKGTVKEARSLPSLMAPQLSREDSALLSIVNMAAQNRFGKSFVDLDLVQQEQITNDLNDVITAFNKNSVGEALEESWKCKRCGSTEHVVEGGDHKCKECGAVIKPAMEAGKYRRVKCDSCDALVINGVATHERGCRNSRKPWVVSDDDEHMVPGERSNDETDESLNEGGHRAGCTCGFCKNKGRFGRNVKAGDDDPEKDEADEKQFRQDRSASSAGKEVRTHLSGGDKVEHTFDSLETPTDVVDRLLCEEPVDEAHYKNPGTQPGILGTKSFSSTKVPSGHKDRPFTPAPGMVQPDSEIVNKQAKRKVNDGK